MIKFGNKNIITTDSLNLATRRGTRNVCSYGCKEIFGWTLSGWHNV